MIVNGTVAVGANPVALAIDSSGKYLFAANQNSGSLSVLAIGGSGGLTPVEAQLPLPNLQCPTPPSSPCPAPVALALTPSTSFLYVTDQMQNLVFTFQVNSSTGVLTANLALPPTATGVAPSGLAMDAAGGLLYVPNRDSESVSGFTISADNSATPGNLTTIPGSFSTGLSPVAAAVDPSGQFLYTADKTSNQVSGFRIKSVSGTLSALSGSPYSAGVAPAFVAISPTNKFLYVSNSGNSSISAYKIDPTSGDLGPASGAVATGGGPMGIAFGR
jgi:6-phosphogluconolactonase (cycloisomerase 2 family)